MTNTLFFFTIIMIISIIILVIYMYNKNFINKYLGLPNDSNSINESFQSTSSDSDLNNIQFTTVQIKNISDFYHTTISRIDRLIAQIESISEKEGITTQTVNTYKNIYDLIINDNSVEKDIFLKQIFFNLDQYLQDKKIREFTQELKILKFRYEEAIRNKIGRKTMDIKSIKNFYNDVNLNVHNVSPIQENYKYQNYYVDEENQNNPDMTTQNTLNECIISCKKDEKCRGITYDKNITVNNCFKNYDKSKKIIKNPAPYNKELKSWQKNNGFIIYLNNGCLTYHEDVLMVNANSPIDSWLDCHKERIGKLQFNDKEGQAIMDLNDEDLKLVKPEYIVKYEYVLSSSQESDRINQININRLLDDLIENNDIVGIRLPLNTVVRKKIIDEISSRETAQNTKFVKYININSSYDLNRCNTENKKQVFDMNEIKTVQDYNKLVRTENDLKKNFAYFGKDEQIKDEVVLPETLEMNEMDRLCQQSCYVDPYCDDYTVRKIDGDFKCVSNPYINYSHIDGDDNEINRENCVDACDKDPFCEGVNFKEDSNSKMKCVGYKNRGHLEDNSSKNIKIYGWKKHNEKTIKNIDNVPTPFYIINNKQYLDEKDKRCVTIQGNDLSVEPCNLSLNQRFNTSNKVRMC